MVVPGAATLQHVFPGQIAEYRSMRRAAAMGKGVDPWSEQNLRFRGARILCFPLEPKPHQVDEHWLQQMWRGDNGEAPGKGDTIVCELDDTAKNTAVDRFVPQGGV